MMTMLTVAGAQKERTEMAESILERRDDINVIVTTYDLAAKKEDNKFLRRLRPDVSIPYVTDARDLLTFLGMRIVRNLSLPASSTTQKPFEYLPLE
jgi:hypothetical protein